MSVAVLCVILFVSQVEMLPVSQVYKVTQMGPMDQVGQTSEPPVPLAGILTRGSTSQVGQTAMDQGPNHSEPKSTLLVTKVLSRVRRSIVGDRKCARGLVKLWRQCVTCEEYMESKGTNTCPIHNG